MPEATPPPPEPTKDVLPEDIAAQIRKAIKEAQEMLEFAVADGLPVSDEVIEKIENALDLLNLHQPLTSKDRAEFEKAYRDLVHTLSPLTIEEVRRETHPDWKRYGRNFALTFLVLAYPSFLFYVVVLALMGSAVSMTRRVPEYQRDAFGLHETLSNAKARENLVFQIMQVFSAPLVVVAAYYLFKPDSRTTTVLLGFASGFASEPILLAIRGLADKLKPASSEDALISVFVSPSSVTLSPGRSQLFTATVRNAANTVVTWSMDPPDIGVLSQSGLYTAPGTVLKEQAIMILATSAADPSKIGKAVVNLILKEEAV